MMNMKKLLALLLAVVMVIGLIPFGAMAEEAEPTETTAPIETTAPVETTAQAASPLIFPSVFRLKNSGTSTLKQNSSVWNTWLYTTSMTTLMPLSWRPLTICLNSFTRTKPS